MPPKEEKQKTNWSICSLIRYWWLLAIAAALVAVAVIWRSCSDNPPVKLEMERSTTIDLTPEEIRSVREIGQWEFLSITTEEMVEWHRHRTFGNDHLVRIYTGTLRIGVDMEKAPDDWFTSLPDSTAQLRLPAIGLLDNNFIDEARTRSFYQKGTVPPDTLEALYQRAQRAMLRRCLTKQNLQNAEQGAHEQFTRIFKSFGFKKVEIEFLK